jgi:glycosyltransferase involved in cell wall biosynthesis
VASFGRAKKPRVLIIVQNLPVPFDRRVWLECKALRDAGYDVHVVCPKGPGDPRHQRHEGVMLHKYRLAPPGNGAFGYAVEYSWSLLMTFWLVARASLGGRFDVIQACNPPDIFWTVARVFRVITKSRFVYDQHDLCPELFDSRFEHPSPALRKGLLWTERQTYRAANHVISTNESYADVAVRRGNKDRRDVTVVRTGPDATKLRREAPDPALRRGRDHLAVYIGVMGPQDGVDYVIRAADVIINKFGRTDIAFTLMGAGDCFDELVALRDELGLGDYVELTGRVPDDVVRAVMSTAAVGLSPDPKNPLNDVSTMNKTMEYMAFELPVVAFDLRETKVSAGAAAVYAEPNRVKDYAQAIVDLVDDEPRRAEMGRFGRQRVETQLAWIHQAPNYVGVYDQLLGRASTPAEPPAHTAPV